MKGVAVRESENDSEKDVQKIADFSEPKMRKAVMDDREMNSRENIVRYGDKECKGARGNGRKENKLRNNSEADKGVQTVTSLPLHLQSKTVDENKNDTLNY